MKTIFFTIAIFLLALGSAACSPKGSSSIISANKSTPNTSRPDDMLSKPDSAPQKVAGPQRNIPEDAPRTIKLMNFILEPSNSSNPNSKFIQYNYGDDYYDDSRQSLPNVNVVLKIDGLYYKVSVRSDRSGLDFCQQSTPFSPHVTPKDRMSWSDEGPDDLVDYGVLGNQGVDSPAEQTYLYQRMSDNKPELNPKNEKSWQAHHTSALDKIMKYLEPEQ